MFLLLSVPGHVFTPLLRLLQPSDEVRSGLCPIPTPPPTPQALVPVNGDSMINLFPGMLFIICSIRKGSAVDLQDGTHHRESVHLTAATNLGSLIFE